MDCKKISSPLAFSETFFNMLEQKRVSLNLTQKEVARQIGVTTRTYKAISNGSAKMATFIDAAIALGFNCTLDEQNHSIKGERRVATPESSYESNKSHSAGQADWHSAQIIAAVKVKAGMSLRQLSLKNNVAPGTVAQALSRPYPHAERIIADALDIEPELIWPSRYAEDGKSVRKRLRPAKK